MSDNLMDNWKQSELWRRHGRGFVIEVNHFTVSTFYPTEGEHRWCVYAYIYPKHRHFKNFNGNEMWQDAASMMPMHGGPTFFKWHRNNDGEITSVQVGCDYNHIYDDSYTFCKNAGEAYSVFLDADDLFTWLDEHPMGEDK
ncbi:MAG TPA: hypothetical protein VFM18_07910 [Methanosarcina sp.]|nr:hypothetical protein [Methanosarcina sp.]